MVAGEVTRDKVQATGKVEVITASVVVVSFRPGAFPVERAVQLDGLR